MSYTSPPYIKQEPEYYSGFSNPDLMSREMLTRGFSSFDDTNISSSMIPEADLLDFEGLGDRYEAAAPPAADSQPTYFSPNQVSTSPFDEFMRPAKPSTSSPRPQSHTLRFLYDNDYIPKQQSNLQSVSVPESSSWTTPPGSFDHSYSSPPLNPEDKNSLLILEKRRRRRESHNAVERRRRDNINEKIQELAQLIPEQLLVGSGYSHNTAGNVGGEDAMASVGKDGKPNKGIILRKSVDYIRQLQLVLDEQRRHNEELELKVQRLELAQKNSGKENYKYEYEDNVFQTSPEEHY